MGQPTKLTARLILAFVTLLAAATPALGSLLHPTAGVGSGGGIVPLCSVAGITCAYAYSLDRQLVTGATKAFQLYNVAQATSQDVGFLGNGRVNVSTAATFCANTQDCLIKTIYDQVGTGCDMTIPPTKAVTDLPLFMAWPAHADLPVFMTGYSQAAGRNQSLANNISACNVLNGNVAKSMIAVTNSRFGSNVGGRGGLSENPQTVVAFAAFSATPAYYNSGVPQYGVDLEGANLAPISTGVVADQIGIDTYDGNNPGTFCMYYNGSTFTQFNSAGSSLGSNCQNPGAFFTSTNHTIATQDWMGWGTDPDNLYHGSEIFFELTYTSNALTSGQAAAAYANTNSFYSGLAAGYSGPGDLLLPTMGADEVQTLWMQNGWGVRAMTASYLGPLLNVCQGVTATCEDIGQVNSLLDTATANSFCGPSNCTVQTAYNQGPKATQNTFDGANQNMVASSASLRPSLTFNCNGTMACLTGNGSQYLCTAGNTNSTSSDYVITGVADRTSGIGFSTIIANLDIFMGLSNSANTAYMQARANGSGASVVAGVNDNTWHSFGVIVNGGTPVNTYYVDAITPVAGTPSSGSSTLTAPLCLFAQPNSHNNLLTGNIAEVAFFASPTGAGLQVTALGSDMANFRTNEKLYYVLP